MRFGHEVRDAVWDADLGRWRIETSRGLFTADVLVAGSGALSEPSIPKLPGLDAFEGLVTSITEFWVNRKYGALVFLHSAGCGIKSLPRAPYG
jgi:hypothetical protein